MDIVVTALCVLAGVAIAIPFKKVRFNFIVGLLLLAGAKIALETTTYASLQEKNNASIGGMLSFLAVGILSLLYMAYRAGTKDKERRN